MKIPANQNLAMEEYIKGLRENFESRIISDPLLDKAKKLINHEAV